METDVGPKKTILLVEREKKKKEVNLELDGINLNRDVKQIVQQAQSPEPE